MYRREGQAAMNQRPDETKTLLRTGRYRPSRSRQQGEAPIGRLAIPL